MVTIATMYFYIILHGLIMWVNFEFGWLKCGPCYIIQALMQVFLPYK